MLARDIKLSLPEIGLVLLLALALSSCSTPQSRGVFHKKEDPPIQGKVRGQPSATRNGSVPSGTPAAHVWAYLTKYGGEEEGFAAYTYVLVGRDSSQKASWVRYTKLIDGIKSSTAEYSPPKAADKSLLNLFLIPIGSWGEDPNYPKPNDKLSIELLTALSTALPGRFDNPGPFLITLNKPIRYGRPGEIANVFFVDLSKMNDKIIQEVVRNYKTTAIQSNRAGEKKLESLQLSLLNTALRVEESYGFVKVAFGELQKAFNSTE
jgi:hypothetical protein